MVGICWHEARAYSAWLSAQTGDRYRLPSEAQWEAATRGLEGRRYAYGPRFDPRAANTFESHIRRTTPVGIFARGDSPDCLSDLSGNVWEWCSSLYHGYPYQPDDGRESEVTEDGRRVLRGGSWDNDQDAARTAYRDLNGPGYRVGNVGLRLVRLSPIFK